jgi:TonB family protein
LRKVSSQQFQETSMPRKIRNFLIIMAVLLGTSLPLVAQAPLSAAEVMRNRISRAKALIAMRNHTAAVFELENLRRETNDPSVLSVVNVLLMNCFVEQGDFRKADEQLVGFYDGTRANRLNASSNYFAVAGQAVKSARHMSERYKSLGLLVNDPNLPPDAVTDLERMRGLLEKIVTQSKTLSAERVHGVNAVALLEEATNARALLAKDDFDARRWSVEIADARASMANSGSTVLDATQQAPVVASPNVAAPIVVAPPVQQTQVPGGRQRRIIGNENPTGSMPSLGLLVDRATQRVNPVYPADARARGLVGLVKVNLVIDERGEVVEIQSVEGPTLLQGAAKDAALKWKFQPYQVDGRAVPAAGYLTFNFSL